MELGHSVNNRVGEVGRDSVFSPDLNLLKFFQVLEMFRIYKRNTLRGIENLGSQWAGLLLSLGLRWGEIALAYLEIV
jgi:hypothetical protein